MNAQRTLGRCIRLILLVATALLVTASCGISTDSHPRAINRDQVRDLLSPSTSAPASENVGPLVLRLYFVRDQRIQEVCRRGFTDEPRAVLTQLLLGPTDAERKAQLLTTFIPPGTYLQSLDLSPGGNLVIALSKDMDALSGASARNAYAQLVFTATGLASVRDVSFRTNGRLIEVPTAGRNKKTVTRADYNQPAEPGDGTASVGAGTKSCVP